MTNVPGDCLAWLENREGDHVPIHGSCSLGRSASNQVALPDDRVSRRHAAIQVQGEDEFWLVDFGSRNGTTLNGRRLSQPTRLRHGDCLGIGPFEFVFREAHPTGPSASATGLANATVTELRPVACWLLVADIIDSTRLARELPPDELPMVTGQWLAECKLTIEGCGGQINQFLGDGFFAYWRDWERVEVSIAKALQALRRIQDAGRPSFRVALHHGQVVFGGMALGEEQRISGREVHFAFRMEKLAGALGHLRLLSEPAWARLSKLIETQDAGSHPLRGVEGDYRFHTY
jgi:class 3 adenylate cyclase